jgi:NADH dehydrogenase
MILVTGATGFVGHVLMRALDTYGIAARPYTGRINNPLQLRAELVDARRVIHLAGAERRGRARLLQHVDVEGTERLIEECRRANIQHIITLSRLGADANAIYPLLRAKGEMERLLRRSGIPYTIIRSATLFGREDRFLNIIVGLAFWSWPFVWLPAGGHVPMQPLWIEDLVRCLVTTLDRPDLQNRVIELGGEERLRYEQIVHLVLAAAGIHRIPLRLHPRLVRPFTLATMGWWRYPPVSRFWLNRYSVPDVAPFDNVLRNFDFRPARINTHMAYLRRPGTWRFLFGG